MTQPKKTIGNEVAATASPPAWVLPVIIAAAAGLRLYGVQWGLPDLFEEATPHRVAWNMWGWGARGGVDVNPHFFNYPSLTIYIQFAIQGMQFAVMRVAGLVASGDDFHARYVADPTAAVTVARLVGVTMGTLTVYATYRAARTVLRWPVAATAAGFVAVATAHVGRSQMIEVDVPLTCFVTLFFVFAFRLLARPSLRGYVICGLLVGLSTATKYTGAFLLPALAAAHILARRSTARGGAAPWSWLAVSAGVFVVTFVVCSPFVFLDAGTALAHIGSERAHMQSGHFGLTGMPAWMAYARMLLGGPLAGGMLGWPLGLAALAGLVTTAFVNRRPWAVVLAAFVVPYVIAVSSWEMRAPRYLLPVLPAVMLFGTAFLANVRPRGIAIALVAVAAVPVFGNYPAHMRDLATDSRTLARNWIESEVPSGSLVVSELYGPELAGGPEWMQMPPDLRRLVENRVGDRPVYGIQPIPLLQVGSERTAVFYDIGLYRDADVIVTTGAVRSRYTADPAKYGMQVAFYDSLEARYDVAREFAPAGRSGSTITVYRSRAGGPFSAETRLAGPRALVAADPGTPSADLFFVNLGLNYELFGHHDAALAAYQLATRYRIFQTRVYESLMRGIVRCLIAQGKRPQARRFLANAEQNAPSTTNRAVLQRIRSDLLSPP